MTDWREKPLRSVSWEQGGEEAVSGILRAIERTGEPYTLADVKSAIESGEAYLLMNELCGLVWHVSICEYTGERTLWVWIAWASNGRDVIADYQWQLLEMARAFGFDRVAFESPRRGYERLLQQPWRKVRVEYEMR